MTAESESYLLLSDGEKLHRRILECPEDDAPRLIYADWLEDHGQDAYAAYIRDRVRNPALATDYVQECTAALHWCEPDDPIRLVNATWRRGFPYFVRCPMDVWMEHAGELVRRWPIQGLVISDRRPMPTTAGGCYLWDAAEYQGVSSYVAQHLIPEAVFNLLDDPAPTRIRSSAKSPHFWDAEHAAVQCMQNAFLKFGRSEAARLNRLEGLI